MARILVVTIAHPPADARIANRQIGALLEHGHTVTYAAPFAAFGQEPPVGVRVIDLPRSAGHPLRRVPALAAAVRMVLVERARQDLVLVHDPELLPALAAARLPGRHRPAAVWDVHEDVPAQVAMLDLPVWVKRPVAGAIHAAELVAERLFHLTVAESSYLRRFRRTHPFVPNSVRVPAGGPWPPEPEPRIVYLGSLTWRRGAREIIELARLVPQVRVEVIGNAKPDVAEALAAAMVELPNLDYSGFIPNREALERLPGALAGLSLLHDEPNYAHSEPTKVMEYMAHGVPTITTPNAASRALVGAARCGAVVPFGDVAAVAEVVRRWDADRASRDELAANGYAAARDHDWNVDGAAFSGVLTRWAGAASARG